MKGGESMSKEVISKIARVKSLEITDGELEKINQLTLAPVTAEEVFTFKAVIADNEQDDRNFEPFTLSALEDLQKLFIGKTMIFDHKHSAENQIARVYDTALEQTDKQTELGEKHTELIAKIYMIKTSGNTDLISEIKGGIKKEVSTACIPDKFVCNICGADNTKNLCRHFPGREYDGKVCKMQIEGCLEAYELSFVAVPAQPRAGTKKSLVESKTDDITKELLARIRLKEIIYNKED